MKSKDEYLCSIYEKRDKKLKEIRHRRKTVISLAAPAFAVVVAFSVIGNNFETGKSVDTAEQEYSSEQNTQIAANFESDRYANDIVTNASGSSVFEKPGFAQDSTKAETVKCYTAEAGTDYFLVLKSLDEIRELENCAESMNDEDFIKFLKVNGYFALGSRTQTKEFLQSVVNTSIPIPGDDYGTVSEISFSGGASGFQTITVCYRQNNGAEFCFKTLTGSGVQSDCSYNCANISEIIK